MRQLTNLDTITKEEFKELLTEIGYPEAYESFLEQFDWEWNRDRIEGVESIEEFFADCSPDNAVLFGVVWDSSKEGNNYWENIHRLINELVIDVTE